MTPTQLTDLADYLRVHGFSGDIPQNSGRKNWLVIKKLMRAEKFYTFGIARVEEAVKNRQVKAKDIRDIMIEASGITIQRFQLRGAGHFNSQLVAERLIDATQDLARRAKAKQTMIFATGHPGAMVGLMAELANWAGSLGAKITTIERAMATADSNLSLDMLGPVFVPSDGCSAAHSHSATLMTKLLKEHPADVVIADHGFAGAALNHGLATIGFYDTDDPAIPLAAWLGLPVLGVPINDNCFNSDGATLARYIIERYGASYGSRKPHQSRTRTH